MKLNPILRLVNLKLTGTAGAGRSLVKPFSISSCLEAGQDWRRKHGLPSNPNAYGPLTDGPDYSFIDGRPTPPGSGKIKRAMEQREISAKIMELSKEVDQAVVLHQNKLREETHRKSEILSRKLNPKGKVPSSSS